MLRNDNLTDLEETCSSVSKVNKEKLSFVLLNKHFCIKNVNKL